MSNYNQLTKDLIQWIKDYFDKPENRHCKAIIGISGGVDSTVAAALCVKALGKDRVLGVLLPQKAITDGTDNDVVSTLGIHFCRIDISGLYDELSTRINYAIDGLEDFLNLSQGGIQDVYAYSTNTPARLRMMIFYGLAAINGDRVVNTCNLSERYVGYMTKFGDAAGDFSPLHNLTKTEIIGIGEALGLPDYLVHKAPSDDMCGQTDEEKFGFSYADLDTYLREGEIDADIFNKIEAMHSKSLHKELAMPAFMPRKENY